MGFSVRHEPPSCTDMSPLPLLLAFALICPLSLCQPMLVDNPFLTIAIDRTDLGSAYDMAVGRQAHSLKLTGPPQPWLFWGCSILSALRSPQSSLHGLPDEPDLVPLVEKPLLEYNLKLTPIYIPLFLLSNNKVY